MKNELVLILDFGGQYGQLIARRIRDCNVYCEVHPCTLSADKIKKLNPKGIIFIGAPYDVDDENAPKCSVEIFELGIPVLGVCYGMQIMAHLLGGEAAPGNVGEYGNATVEIDTTSKLFAGLDNETTCFLCNGYNVKKLPVGFEAVAKTDDFSVFAFENKEKALYGVQFHPEANHTPQGTKILKNFLYNICGCSGDWTMEDFVVRETQALQAKIGGKKVLCAMSGGVDSSVAAVMVHKAVGKQLTCVLVDHGLMRKNEADEVEAVFKHEFDMNLIRVNAKERFLNRLKGITDPEQKRKIIGEEFIRVFEEEAKKIGSVDYLVQGTIYPDVIESGIGDKAVIKSHHNVGGLPDYIDFKEIIEPLKDLFKDEVRKAGIALGIPAHLVWRQPFPGPGLGIRVIGEVTEEKLEILREADAIFREEIMNSGLNQEINQYFAVLTGMRSVGVTGDERTYDYTIALRAVSTTDFMNAHWSRIPYDLLEKISNRIVNEVEHVNRIVYDITGKPPATIEWE